MCVRVSRQREVNPLKTIAVKNKKRTKKVNVMKQLIDRHISTLVLWPPDMTKIYDYHVSIGWSHTYILYTYTACCWSAAGGRMVMWVMGAAISALVMLVNRHFRCSFMLAHVDKHDPGGKESKATSGLSFKILLLVVKNGR